jgi:hypothetical protein
MLPPGNQTRVARKASIFLLDIEADTGCFTKLYMAGKSQCSATIGIMPDWQTVSIRLFVYKVFCTIMQLRLTLMHGQLGNAWHLTNIITSEGWQQC